MLVLDIETNLIPATKIWCAVTEDVDTGEISVFKTSDGLQEHINASDGVIAHNGVGFDFPVLEELWGVTVPWDKVVDTLVMARLYQPQINNGHSLKAWGIRLGNKLLEKQEFNKADFEHGLTDEMLEYCKQDVKVNVALYKKLKQLLSDGGFSQFSIDLERDVAIITNEQERNGFKLDIPHATECWQQITRRMQTIDNEMQDLFPPITTERVSEKTGKPLKDHVEHFNVGSRQQVAKRLSTLGAKWTELTETGLPVVNEKTLEKQTIPEAAIVSEYFLLQKRCGLFDSWLKSVKDDGRVHGRVNTIGAITGRMTHSSPNMAQVPSVRAPWGKESRSSFIVEDGNVLVGCDASGLELRMLAHYVNDPEYTKQILEGDIHTYNQDMAGLETRDQAKTFIYALLYGAGDTKIGSITGHGAARGKELKASFAKGLPGYARLVKQMKGASSSGKVKGLDGRMIRIRSEHASLNTLLQGGGAIVMKVALVEAYKNLKAANIPFKIVANIHDEIQVETPAHFGKAVGMQIKKGIVATTDILKLHCPMDGDFKTGANWCETH
jgi:DNA polymerase I-like protein with 3'-5' exonuclease and polymerase domains